MFDRRRPAVTVIIPTYNWSSALTCAIRSVLLQTLQDFEILVVGDGCTDDSEAVVAAFADSRIRWRNLPRNHGSQWAANNYALEIASGDWIAYLGHDDIWHPRHLAAVTETARRERADIVTSTLITYGPPGSRVRGVAGIFPNGAFGENDFVPPSAVSHAKRLYGDGIVWRDPDTVATPMDAAFLNDLCLARLRFGATNELTVFKFNAAYRRNSYRIRSTEEQESLLRRIEAGIDVRQAELHGVIEAMVSGLFLPPQPFAPSTEKGAVVRRNRALKGVASRYRSDDLIRVEVATRFDMSAQEAPFEWYALETTPEGSTFRWSGPSRRATIDLPVVVDRDLGVSLHILMALHPDTIAATTLSIHERPLTVAVRPDGHGATLETVIRPADLADNGRDFGITLDAGALLRPCDTGASDDRRWLGVAVDWVELRPL